MSIRYRAMLQDEPVDPECTGRHLNACEGEDFFGEHEGKRYCVLHFPSIDKKDAFSLAINRKLESKDSNYKGVWFPDQAAFRDLEFEQKADFSSAVFNGRASFDGAKFKFEATFSGATFHDDARFEGVTFAEKVDFSSATFQQKAYFRGTRFQAHADFWRCVFKGNVDFSRTVFLQAASFWPSTFGSTASFYEASFRWADFRVSKFHGHADFRFCSFENAEFIGVTFKDEAIFTFSKFDGIANFVRAKFDSTTRLNMSTFEKEARFTFASFNGSVDFSYTVFKDIVSFSAEDETDGFGTDAALDFRNTRFESPSRVSFHGLILRPHWFLNVDPRPLTFIDVKWIGQLRRRFIDVEIEELRKREVLERKSVANSIAERIKELSLFGDEEAIEELKQEQAEVTRLAARGPNNQRFYRLMSIACRQLAINAEENHRYDQASDFRSWSMEMQRKEGWGSRGRLSIGILHSLYRLLSGYGEDVARALMILVVMCLVFAAVYTQVGFSRTLVSSSPVVTSGTEERGRPQTLTRALVYSVAVSTLQRPDPRPLTTAAIAAVFIQTLLGPIQVALLILAIRRRFMR